MVRIQSLSKFFSFLFVVLSSTAVFGQSRAPEIKLEEKYKHDAKSKEVSEYDEQPYFILIDQSERALEDGNYHDAALRLVEAMSIEPDNPLNVALLSNLGMIYYYDNQDTLALQVLDEAVKRSPNLISAHENRARVLTGLGRDEEAYKEYGEILDIDSLHLSSRFMHGMMALYGGNLSVAEKDIDFLQKAAPNSMKTWLALGTLYSLTRRETEAISYFKKLIDKEPAVEYYGRLIACYLAMEEFDSASETIGTAMGKFPDDAELFYYRAILNKKRYLNDEANRDAKRAIELGADPDRVRSIFLIK